MKIRLMQSGISLMPIGVLHKIGENYGIIKHREVLSCLKP